MTKNIIWTDPDGDTVTVIHAPLADPLYRILLETAQGVSTGDAAIRGLVALPTDPADRKHFIKELAFALSVDAQFPTPREVTKCVSVAPPFPDETDWNVAGDVYEGLTDAETVRADQLLRPGDGGSFNYMVARILIENPGFGFGDLKMDPESSCFFAYPKDEASARELAAWINDKEWLL